MSGKMVIGAFLAFLVIFVVGLVYAQLFAFYKDTEAPVAIYVGDIRVPVRAWEGIDANTSPLKMRACFTTNYDALHRAEPVTDATPLTAPMWFECYDARTIAEDLAAGRARAYAVTRDEPVGFDTMLALYPGGEAYMWRQLNERFRD